jgi:hypothetical protein
VLEYQWGKVVGTDFVPVSDNVLPLPTDPDIFTGATTKTLKITNFTAAATYACRITLPEALDSLSGSAKSAIAGMTKLNVLDVPVLDVITPTPTSLPAGTVGTPYSYQFVLDSESSPVTKWTATGLPTGLTINATTGLISGTPTENRNWDKVLIRASNATGTVIWPAQPPPATPPNPTVNGSILINPGIEVTNTTIAIVRGKVATASVRTFKNNVGYQWYRTDAPTTPLVNGVAANGSKIAGATTSKLTITGFTDAAPSNVGSYFCKVTVKLPPSTTNTQVFDSGTTTFVIMQDPDLQDPGTGMDNPITLPTATVGALYTYQFPVVNDPSRPLAWSIKGLPAGLTIDPKTGIISGTITKLPSTTLYNAATNSYTISNIEVIGKNAVATVRSPTPAVPPATQTFHTLEVKALPLTAVGNFVALIDRDGVASTAGATKKHGGRLTLSATVSGAVTGKVFIGRDTTKGLSFKTKLVSTDNTGAAMAEPTGVAYIAQKGKPHLQVDFTLRAGDVLEGTVREVTGGVFNIKTLILTGGTVVADSETEFSGWRSRWVSKVSLPFQPVLVAPTADWVGLHNVSLKLPSSAPATLPQGTGYAAINVIGTGQSVGNVTVVGKTALGEAFTCSAPLSPLGEVLVYAGVNSSNKVFTGSLHGFVNIQSAPNAHSINDSGILTWGRSTQSSTERKYRKGWDTPLALDVAGSLYVPPVAPNVILGLPVPASPTVNNASILFTGGGIELEQATATARPNIPELNPETSPGFQIFAPASNNIAKLPASSNKGKTTLKIDPKTGIFSGTFETVDRNGTVRRSKVPFAGMVVPLPVDLTPAISTDNFDALGYFLLPEMLPAPDTSTTRTPINSGLVKIQAFN